MLLDTDHFRGAIFRRLPDRILILVEVHAGLDDRAVVAHLEYLGTGILAQPALRTFVLVNRYPGDSHIGLLSQDVDDEKVEVVPRNLVG